MKTLLVDKSNLFRTDIQSFSPPEPKAGQTLFKVEKYAFTTNNITYAVAAPQLNYWDFFPAPEPWGIIPVWGYARVISAGHESIQQGDRYYGYFPMSEFLLVNPGKVNPMGFTDLAEHRQALSPVYNFYNNIANDPGYHPASEDYLPIIKPLFVTSFLNYHFLKEEKFFEADQLILTSASSKTGLALAFMLKNNQAADGKKIIGLTSAPNVEFVENTGYYDQVINYDEAINALPKSGSVIIDFAGNADLLYQIYEKMGPELKYISLIGLTDWTSGKAFKRIPVSRFFFAPTYAQKKFQEWGVKATNEAIAKVLSKFILDAQKWLELTYIQDWPALSELYLNMLKGKVDPSKGYIVKLIS